MLQRSLISHLVAFRSTVDAVLGYHFNNMLTSAEKKTQRCQFAFPRTVVLRDEVTHELRQRQKRESCQCPFVISFALYVLDLVQTEGINIALANEYEEVDIEAHGCFRTMSHLSVSHLSLTCKYAHPL